MYSYKCKRSNVANRYTCICTCVYICIYIYANANIYVLHLHMCKNVICMLYYIYYVRVHVWYIYLHLDNVEGVNFDEYSIHGAYRICCNQMPFKRGLN